MAYSKPTDISSITYVLTKLVNLGVFPPSIPTARSQPSFFLATLPTIRARLNTETHTTYFALWHEVLASLPSTFALHAILTSLFSSLSQPFEGLDPSLPQRRLVKREATLLRQIVGRLSTDSGEIWESVSAIALGREWSESHARIFTCWVAGAEKDTVDEDGKLWQGCLHTSTSN
jgi:telomere length regulation protein